MEVFKLYPENKQDGKRPEEFVEDEENFGKLICGLEMAPNKEGTMTGTGCR